LRSSPQRRRSSRCGPLAPFYRVLVLVLERPGRPCSSLCSASATAVAAADPVARRRSLGGAGAFFGRGSFASLAASPASRAEPHEPGPSATTPSSSAASASASSRFRTCPDHGLVLERSSMACPAAFRVPRAVRSASSPRALAPSPAVRRAPRRPVGLAAAFGESFLRRRSPSRGPAGRGGVASSIYSAQKFWSPFPVRGQAPPRTARSAQA